MTNHDQTFRHEFVSDVFVQNRRGSVGNATHDLNGGLLFLFCVITLTQGIAEFSQQEKLMTINGGYG